MVALSVVACRSGKGAANFLFCKEKTTMTKMITKLKMVMAVHFRIVLNRFMLVDFGGRDISKTLTRQDN